MKCSIVQSFFDRIYREGDTFNHPGIIDHLNQCQKCYDEYHRWCGIARKLEHTPVFNAPPELYNKVLRAINEHTTVDVNLTRIPPRQLKLLPYSMAFATLLLIAAVSLFIVQPRVAMRRIPEVAAPSLPLPTGVLTHFEISLAHARQVAIVGDFNGWNKEKHFLARNDNGIWEINLTLPGGSYQYLFLVDGTLWKTDPHRTRHVPDGFGGFNTVIDL